MSDEIKCGKYRHFKGNEYEVIGVARHSETMEPLVVYRALYGEYGLWVRPATMWTEMVEYQGCQMKRFTYIEKERPNGISHLWNNGTENDWQKALAHYDELSRKRNFELDQYLAKLDYRVVAAMTAEEFYDFLYNQYFVWKYTAPNRLATTRKHLRKYIDNDELLALGGIKREIFSSNKKDTAVMLSTVAKIRGLGIPGASGLLSILFPEDFGTVDQFVVISLRGIDQLPERDQLEKMKPELITLKNAIVLERILRKKAEELNRRFSTNFWTPRKIDMVLWSFGR